MRTLTAQRGLSFIDVVVASAIILLVFGGIIAGFRLSIALVALSSGQQGALSIANDQIEFLRSLSYDAVGTVGGIPGGNIPQEETITLNNIAYTKRVLIQYVDAEEDGIDLADENNVTADYKRARVSVSWKSRGTTYEEVLVTNIVPKGVETTEGGGTLRVEVFDALVNPVENADIRIINASTSPAIDVTTFTNVLGLSLFSGTPTSSGYQIIATKDGYSTTQTYSASSSNPNPNPGHVTVLESQTTSISLSIDRLSSTTVTTIEPVTHATTTDTFSGSGGVLYATSTVVSAGSITLLDEGGGYPSNGEAMSTNIAPPLLDEWDAFSWNDTTPSDTDVIYKIYYDDGSGGPTLIPDFDLSGNSTGLSVSPVDLSGLTPVIYNNLFIEAILTTAISTTTPAVDDWTLTYFEGPTPIPNIAFAVRGNKTIGDNGGTPIYKYDTSTSTDGSGAVTLHDLEWDTYTITMDGSTTGYDISESCNPSPLSLDPNTATTTELTLVTHTTHSLRVVVKAASGGLLPNATVRLSGGGYDETYQTSSCGQTFFSSIPGSGSYMLDTSLSGYTSDSQIVDVDGTTAISVTLN